MLRSFRRYLFLLVVGVSACVPREPPEPPPPPPLPTPQVLFEEEVRPIERPELAILNVDEARNRGSATVTVTGTILNRGTGPARNLIVTVSALDAAGATLLSVPGTPSTARIAPGSTATFRATFERPAGTDQYHVEAVGR